MPMCPATSTRQDTTVILAATIRLALLIAPKAWLEPIATTIVVIAIAVAKLLDERLV